jgi:RNA polymerase sigma-70 factor (ECF subfamily)
MGNYTNAIRLSAQEAMQVTSLRAGSEEAYRWLISEYHQPIYSFLVHSLHDAADAADVTQEVFLKAFRGIGQFHGDASLRTWLFRIAVHEAANRRRWWFRHKRREVSVDAPAAMGDADAAQLGDTLIAQGASPYEAAVQQEASRRIADALAEVAEPFRSAVVLRDIQGFAYEEMAEVLGITLGTVKSRITRGRMALREVLLKAGAR